MFRRIKAVLRSTFFPHDGKSTHNPELDGLRGLAIIIVLISHFANEGVLELNFNLQQSGKIGVYLFFVLSSFLLDRQILLAILEKSDSYKYWLNYVLRRFVRIIPLFYFVSIIYFLVSSGIKIPELPISSLESLIAHILLIDGEYQFWSIPVELKYYILSPLIFILLMKLFQLRDLQKIANLLLISSAILFIIVSTLGFLIPTIFKDYETSLLIYLPVFLIGSFLSVHEMQEYSAFRQIMTSHFNRRLIIIVGLFILASTKEVYYWIIPIDQKYIFHRLGYFYAILWGCTLVIIRMKENSTVNNFFSHWFLRFNGIVSFSLYLWHVLMIKSVKYLFPYLDSIYQLILIIGLTYVVSCLSYLLIETPLSKIRLKIR